MASETPEILYHYCSLETLSKIVGDIMETRRIKRTTKSSAGKKTKVKSPKMISRIQMTSYHHLNDPKESLMIPSLYDGVCYEKYFEKILDNSKTFVSCFSAQRDNLNMWRSYAHDGRGVCIGFDSSKLNGVIKRIKDDQSIDQTCCQVVLSSIKYVGENEQNDILEDGIGRLIFSDLKNPESLENKSEKQLLDKAIECWSIKSSDYELEQEWRLIATFDKTYFQKNFLDTILSGKIRGNKISNFDLQYRFHEDSMTERLFLRLDSKCIKEVILGPKCSALKSEIERYLRLHFNENVDVSESKKKYR